VLETLVLYDYPVITGKARYRSGRVQTDFSRKAKVEAALDRFATAAASTGAPLYLSYPANGLLQTADASVPDVLRRHYRRVRIVLSASLRHSTLGAAPGFASVEVMENVYHAVP
jgi:hypothetical protein